MPVVHDTSKPWCFDEAPTLKGEFFVSRFFRADQIYWATLKMATFSMSSQYLPEGQQILPAQVVRAD